MNGNGSKLPAAPPLPLRGTSPKGGSKKSAPERFSGCSRPRRRTAVSCRAELPPQRLRGAVGTRVFMKSRANSQWPPLASPGGKLARPVRGVTEEGWRQPKYCLHLVRWYQSQIIADYFPLFRFIYHMENGFYKTSPLLHSPNPS